MWVTVGLSCRGIFCLTLSRDGGSHIYSLTRDHKPSDEKERKRIIEAGGQVYQAGIARPGIQPEPVGPHRVFPGRLSVCRTFGDAEAKLGPNGNPNVVIAVPEIKSFKIEEGHDFIIMGSDGIFDKLSNKEAVQCVWNSIRQERMEKVHQQCGVAVDTVLKNALFRKSLDNVTVVMIAFANYKKLLKAEMKNENKENQNKLDRKSVV